MYKQQNCIRRQLGACDTFGIPPRRKKASQACLQSFSGSSLQTTYDYQLFNSFNELQSSTTVGNFCFSTIDYCTVKLAPKAAKLTVLFLCNLRREGKVFFTTHATNINNDIVTQRSTLRDGTKCTSRHYLFSLISRSA